MVRFFNSSKFDFFKRVNWTILVVFKIFFTRERPRRDFFVRDFAEILKSMRDRKVCPEKS